MFKALAVLGLVFVVGDLLVMLAVVHTVRLAATPVIHTASSGSSSGFSSLLDSWRTSAASLTQIVQSQP